MNWLPPLLQWDAQASTRIVNIAALETAPWRRTTALTLAHTGDSWLVLLVGGLLWALGLPQLGISLIFTVLVTATLSSLLKAIIRRTRPTSQDAQLYLGPDRYSFPSGHATRLGGVLVIAAGTVPLWGMALLTLWALTVCLSRISLRAHYLGDIIGGLVVGSSIMLFILMIVK